MTDQRPSTSTPNETTPLNPTTQVGETPLPQPQFFILLITRFSEPFAFSLLFPFVYFMVKGFQLTEDDNQIGLYVGYIASSFAVAQTCTSLFWGNLSDRIGRKPVVIIGLIGSGLTLMMFGLSKTLLWAIVTRSASGFLNGNMTVVRTMATELTDKTNRPKGFSYFPLAVGLGSIFGAATGGYLSNPAEKFPAIFGRILFLREYPYFLPCFVGGILDLINAVVAYIFLEETLKSKTQFKGPQDSERLIYSRASTSTEEPPNTNQSNFSISKQSKIIISGFGLLSLSSVISNELFILWSVTSIPKGGLEFKTDDISNILTISGVFILIIQLYTFPVIQKWLGVLNLYRYSFPLYILTCITMPMLNFLVKSNYFILMWICLIFLSILRAIGIIMAGTSLNLLLVESAEDNGNLGTLNGYNQTLANFCKAIGPTLCGAAYSWSLSHDYYFPLDRYFVWCILILFCGLNYILSYYITINYPN